MPQSATGQTALFTGRNAAKFLGRHQTGFANGSLRQLIEASGLFKQVGITPKIIDTVVLKIPNEKGKILA